MLENQSIIEGIRHRILAHLFRQRSAEGPSSGALRRFFFHFQEYASIIIWKASLPGPGSTLSASPDSNEGGEFFDYVHVEEHPKADAQDMPVAMQVQFLDRRRLLLSAGLPNASRSRSGDVSAIHLLQLTVILHAKSLISRRLYMCNKKFAKHRGLRMLVNCSHTFSSSMTGTVARC